MHPLAALPPYGCGVPLAGCERPVQGYSTAQGRWCTSTLPDVSLRGGRRPTWQSRSTRLDHRGTFGENVTACTRLPRPLWGLAMTNLWRSPSYRQPALAVSTAPGAACRSPTMAGACIGGGPNLRAVHGASGTPHPTTRHRYFNNTPQKCSLSFLRLHFLSAELEKMRASGALFLLRRRGRRGQESADASERSRHDVVLSDNKWSKCTKSC